MSCSDSLRLRVKKLSDDVGKREHRDLSEVDRKDGPTPVFETVEILFRASVSWLSVYRVEQALA